MIVYLKRERILVGSYNKLKLKKYSSFKIANKISDNTYVVNLINHMTMLKAFNLADLYVYQPMEQLYPDDNSRTSSFEEGGTDVGDQEEQQQTQSRMTLL